MKNLFAFSRRIYSENGITAVRKGLLSLFPLILIASFCTFLQYFPAKSYTEFMFRLFGPDWQKIFHFIYGSSMGIVAVALVVSISHSLAEGSKIRGIGSLSTSVPCVVSLMCYFSLAWSMGVNVRTFFLSADGLLIAILTGVFATRLFLVLYSFTRKRIGDIGLDSEPALSQALYSIFPAIITVLLWSALEMAILKLGFKNSMEPVVYFVNGILNVISNSFVKIIVITLITQLLWFFGIHGDLVMQPILSSAPPGKPADINYDAVVQALPGAGNPEMLMHSFINVFVNIGGTGGTLCLLAAILLTAGRTSRKRLVEISLLPSVFNINEILTFGLPVVLNPIFLIPFLITPVILLVLSYLAIFSGLVPRVSSNVVWTTPPLLNAYYACGSFRGVLLQVFSIAVGTLIYLPFVKANEKILQSRMESTYEELKKLLENRSYGNTVMLLNRKDDIGHLAGVLAKEILTAIKEDKFLLEYQPLINNNTEVKGVEALLRWPHEKFGRIPPMITTAIAEEAGCMNELGKWVIRRACKQMAQWKADGLKGIAMSINISPTQLKDVSFTEELLRCIAEYGIEANEIELEITETVVLELVGKTRDNIEKMSARGIRLAMDDFGMGYTSLLYIRHFNIDTIKIDGSIIRDILRDKSCQDIVSSMVFLCNTLNIKVIAEYVEEAGQFELLKSLGCSEYQGYLFSPPLPGEDTVRFISERNQVLMPC